MIALSIINLHFFSVMIFYINGHSFPVICISKWIRTVWNHHKIPISLRNCIFCVCISNQNEQKKNNGQNIANIFRIGCWWLCVGSTLVENQNDLFVYLIEELVFFLHLVFACLIIFCFGILQRIVAKTKSSAVVHRTVKRNVIDISDPDAQDSK